MTHNSQCNIVLGEEENHYGWYCLTHDVPVDEDAVSFLQEEFIEMQDEQRKEKLL